MDINCVFNCEYQKEGKCSLTELPETIEASVSDRQKADKVDCLYFKKSI